MGINLVVSSIPLLLQLLLQQSVLLDSSQELELSDEVSVLRPTKATYVRLIKTYSWQLECSSSSDNELFECANKSAWNSFFIFLPSFAPLVNSLSSDFFLFSNVCNSQ